MSAEPAVFARGIVIWTSPLPVPPTPDLVQRFGVYPRPFHELALAGFEIVPGDTLPRLRAALRQARSSGRKAVLFCYSLRGYDVLIATLYAFRVPLLVYYQNIPPERMPLLKRISVQYALRRARLILLQDGLRLERFRARYGAARTRFFPWVVDDAFFRPASAAAPHPANAPLFVPGDRDRLDDVVVALARRTGRRIIRVSRHYSRAALAAYQACPQVDLRYYVRWEELRQLYQECALVLNMTDDAQSSAGMTTFLEGLAMNALVLTPGGHSSAGFEFSDGDKPYIVVPEPRCVESWIEALAVAERHPRTWPSGRSPRDLFLQFSSTAAAADRWRALFEEATA